MLGSEIQDPCDLNNCVDILPKAKTRVPIKMKSEDVKSNHVHLIQKGILLFPQVLI